MRYLGLRKENEERQSHEWPQAGSSTGVIPAVTQPTSRFGETSGTFRDTRAPPGEQLDGTRNVGLGEIRQDFGIKITPVSSFCLSITCPWNVTADESEQNLSVLPAVLYPLVLARLHHVLTTAEKIKLLLRLLLHCDLKTLADIKSSVSLAACNVEWMLLREERSSQPGVKHSEFLPPGTFSVQTVLWVSLQVRIFQTKTKLNITSPVEKLCCSKSPTFISVLQRKSK